MSPNKPLHIIAKLTDCDQVNSLNTKLNSAKLALADKEIWLLEATRSTGQATTILSPPIGNQTVNTTLTGDTRPAKTNKYLPKRKTDRHEAYPNHLALQRCPKI
jgi:hypothetical protein